MPEINQGKILLKSAIPALIEVAKELPIIGVPIRLSFAFQKIWAQQLQAAQDALPEEKRPEQLQQAAALRPNEARALALEFLNEATPGRALNQTEREAVADVVAMIPGRIQERTHATLMQAKRYGTVAQEALPLSAKASTLQREEFYSSLLPTSRPQFHPGDPLPHGNPEWRLVELIGTGGFGEVWLSRHDYLGEERAVKFCQNEVGNAILQREAANLYRLRQSLPNHPHIVRLYDLQLKHQPFWLTFEYVQGGTLESLMRARGAIPWREALIIIYPVWHAMAQVHALEIVHRDLKPANILFSDKNVPKIADFGIGKVLAEQVEAAGAPNRRSQGMTTRGYGSAGYMSPEQEEGEAAHPADDIYALAIILWQMMVGNLERTPRFPKDIQILDIPDILKKIISACRFLPREQRPQDMKILTFFKQLIQTNKTVESTPQPVTAAPVTESVPEPEPAKIVQKEIVTPPMPSLVRKIEPENKLDTTTSAPQVEEEDEEEVENADSNPDDSEEESTTTPSTPQPTTGVGITEPHEHYLINLDGTVTDTRTGLMWKRCAEGQVWDGTTCKKKEARITWNDCMPDGQQKSWPEFAGFNDWRLPTHEELRTLVYCSSGQPQTWHKTGKKQCEGEYQQPTIDQAAFPKTPLATFWTVSTTNEKYATFVSFKLGYCSSGGSRFSPLRVRLVRGTFLGATTAEPVPDNVMVEEPILPIEPIAPPQPAPVVELLSPSQPPNDATLIEGKEVEAKNTDSNPDESEGELTDTSSKPPLTTIVAQTEPHDHYLIHQDGTVTDTRTGLMWKRCAEGQIWDGKTCSGRAIKITGYIAMSNGEQKNWLNFAGYDDWRVPTFEELKSLIHCSSGKLQVRNNAGSGCKGNYLSPTVNQTVFPKTPSTWFWSVSSSNYFSDRLLIVHFQDGVTGNQPINNNGVVRLVRGTVLGTTVEPVPDNVTAEKPILPAEPIAPTEPVAVTESLPPAAIAELSQPLSPELQTPPIMAEMPQYVQHEHYLIHADGTVTDVSTNLMWKRCPEGQEWDGQNCVGGSVRMTRDQILPDDKQKSWPAFAGYDNWRVPTIKELASLIYCSSGNPKTWNTAGKECQGEYIKPTIDPIAFPNTPSTWFWSETIVTQKTEFCLLAVFSIGLIRRINRHGSYAVRLVRDINAVKLSEPMISRLSAAATEPLPPLPAEPQTLPLVAALRLLSKTPEEQAKELMDTISNRTFKKAYTVWELDEHGKITPDCRKFLCRWANSKQPPEIVAIIIEVCKLLNVSCKE